MDDEVILDGMGEDVPAHRLLEGTDLQIAYKLSGDSPVIRVNKGPWQVFRVTLKDAVPRINELELLRFNRVSPDFTFRVGHTKGRMLTLGRSVGLDAMQLARLERRLGVVRV
jgi:hypothetical protein